MYRNVVYEIADDWSGVIKLFTWDSNGKPKMETIPHSSHLYYEYPDGEYTSMFNTKLKRKEFTSVIERNKWIKNNPNTVIYEALPPEREFLIERFEGQQEDPEFRKFEFRTHFLDIEVAVGINPDYKNDHPIKIRKRR